MEKSMILFTAGEIFVFFFNTMRHFFEDDIVNKATSVEASSKVDNSEKENHLNWTKIGICIWRAPHKDNKNMRENEYLTACDIRNFRVDDDIPNID